MVDSNQKTYTSPLVVQHYAQLKMLQPAEETILDLFRDRWSTIKLLDMGVGGGRTTQHFAKRVAEYVGIDYSTDMIATCEQRFAALSSLKFAVCDARDLSQFPDHSFDFILFSFNGIDYISDGDRVKVFEEVRRVGKPEGYFFFSTHNLQGLELEFDIKKHIGWNPVTTYVNLMMWFLLRVINYPLTLNQLRVASHTIVRDESHNFRLKTYYIRPTAQVRQLKQYFDDIKVYSWKTGSELTSEADMSANCDMWLYYLCKI